LPTQYLQVDVDKLIPRCLVLWSRLCNS